MEAKVIAAHCVHIDSGEMRTLLHAGAGVSHNPSSNLKLASGFAPVIKMLETGLNVGIGTDGPASNNDLDMFEEVRLAAFVAKAVTNDPTSLPAATALTMATRMGAQALHLGHITGSLTPGLRADLILVDLSPLHNSPSFRRVADNIYAQIVYASKAVDVTDVMCNGRWLMRDRTLLTVAGDASCWPRRAGIAAPDGCLPGRTRTIHAFEADRPGWLDGAGILRSPGEGEGRGPRGRKAKRCSKPPSKLCAFGTIGQHDNYFHFDDPAQGRLRYREDDFLDESGAVTSTRSRLTLLGQKREGKFEHDVLLSRSRFFAPATQSLRFYREYFRPAGETTITKDRERWLINFRDTEFFINLDKMLEPAIGRFVEVKSRTWSRRDADLKAALTSELLDVLGLGKSETVGRDYIEVVAPGR